MNQWADGPAYERYYAFDGYPETERGGDLLKMTFERSVTMPRGLNWFQREDDFLLQAVQEHGKNWIKVAQSVSKLKADPGIGRARYSELIKKQSTAGWWSRSEDAQLLAAHSKFGDSWSVISIHVPGRSAKQVRERYKSLLLP